MTSPTELREAVAKIIARGHDPRHGDHVLAGRVVALFQPLAEENRKLREALDDETVKTVLKLGHPYPTIGHLAFDEMHSDDIILSHSGVHLTVGDVRGLQVLLLALGFKSPDRLTALADQGGAL